LDIGTGNGVFLEELLKLGFSNIAGVEPSKTPVASSSPAVRPFIKLGVFQGSDYSQNQFALVTCFQTLEHLSDPLKTCREIHRILKPGGAFYAVAHNRLSPINRLLGRYSPIFDIEHLQLFSSESLIGLLKTAGYETVECWSIRNTYPLHYWIKLFPIPRLLKTSILRFLKGSGIDQLPITLPVGNIAVVGFKSLERT
jgi:SAM-dependent methyltransferase